MTQKTKISSNLRCKQIIFISIIATCVVACQKKPSTQYENLYLDYSNNSPLKSNQLSKSTNIEHNIIDQSDTPIDDNNYLVEINYTTNNNVNETFVTLAKVKNGFVQQIKLNSDIWLRIHQENTNKIDIHTRECDVKSLDKYKNCRIKIIESSSSPQL